MPAGRSTSVPIRVQADGSLGARIAVIAEAPAQAEEAQGHPLVGPSGQKWMGWLREVGLARNDLWIDNVYPFRALKNKIALVPKSDLEPWIANLHERIAALDDPWLIVPMGNVALRALTGKSQITKHRGSIYAYTDQRGRTIKVIPTIHPAAIFRTPTWERRCRVDWARIASDAAFRDLRTPVREHFISPTLVDCQDFYADAAVRAEVLALDIETPRRMTVTETPGKLKKDGTLGKSRVSRIKGAARVTCIAFSFEPHFSLTIPTTLEYWGSESALEAAWDVIRALCALPCAKALQNGLFDTFWLLADHDCPVRNYRWDTRWMHHALDALDSHSLAYMASCDTREPYWKDDAKDGGDLDAEWNNLEVFHRYCGKDAAVTCELAGVYASRLTDSGQTDFYLRHYRALFGPLLAASLGGIRLDRVAQRWEASRLHAACIEIQDKLTAIAGEPLYGTKDLSVKRLAHFLYETLKLPRQMVRDKKTGESHVTTREVTVRKLMIQFPVKLGRLDEPERAGALILTHRRKSKLGSFVKDGVADDDGRVRCQYGFAETGRLTSSKNPRRTGQNLQNVDRALRHLYLPDKGKFWLEPDESQGEDRIVKALTGSPRLIERARSMPWENDEHRRAAEVIFGIPQAEINSEQRYLGKRVRHAGNYGMGGFTFSDELLKDGLIYTPEEAGLMIAAVIDRDTPEVRDWQQRVRSLVLRDRAMSNSWGRVWDFKYERMNDDLYRFAYACVPQSELVEIVNQWGFIPLYKWLNQSRMQSRINHQNHDSLLISTVIEEAYDVACFLKQSLERPRTYWGTKLTIPVEFKCGLTWKHTVEFKRFPDRAEFEERIREMLAGAKAA